MYQKFFFLVLLAIAISACEAEKIRVHIRSLDNLKHGGKLTVDPKTVTVGHLVSNYFGHKKQDKDLSKYPNLKVVNTAGVEYKLSDTLEASNITDEHVIFVSTSGENLKGNLENFDKLTKTKPYYKKFATSSLDKNDNKEN